jgi:hypothetical protein
MNTSTVNQAWGKDATGLPLNGARDTNGQPVNPPKTGTGHALITGSIRGISLLMLLGGLIGVLILASDGEDGYLYETASTLSVGAAWAVAAVLVLQFALLQAVALGLDYLERIAAALRRPEAS